MSCGGSFGGSLAGAVAALLKALGAGGSCGCGAPMFGYPAGKSVTVPVAGTTLAPQPIPLEGIIKVRILAVRTQDNAMLLLVSTPNGGAAQQVPLSPLGVVVMVLPNPGDEATALSLVGTGVVEYLVAGELAA